MKGFEMSAEQVAEFNSREKFKPRSGVSVPSPILTPPPEAKVAGNAGECPLEDQEQAALIVWLKQRGIRVHHSPNGGYRKMTTAVAMKKQGVSPGFPDLLIFPETDKKYQPILFIEMKRQKGGQVSDEQKEWLEYLTDIGPNFNIRAAVCQGFEEARSYILSWGY